VAGEDCLIIKTRLATPGELEALINRIRNQISVQRSITMIALSTIKEDTPINVWIAAAESQTEAHPIPT
jgi:hypothetical protein